MLLQVGAAFGPQYHSDGVDLAETIGVLWTPWKFGGLWSEVGVMNEPVAYVRLADLSDPLPGRSHQHLEASAGLIAVGSEATTGYFKAGVGAFRVETGGEAPKFLVSAPPIQPTSFTTIHWTMGAILAAGLRFGGERMHALPMIEWRAQVEPDSYGETRVLLMATGGVWFR